MPKFFLVLFFAILCQGLQAQDPTYSQFHSAPLELNPALAGVVAAPFITLNYRNQWPNIPNAYSTYSASYSQYVPNWNSGFGALFNADVAGGGIYNSYRVGLFYAYDIRFSEKFFIRGGLEANFINKRIGWNKLVFLDQIDLEYGNVDVNGIATQTREGQPGYNVNYMDFGFGVLLSTPYVYGGFSLKHINAPSEGFMRIGQEKGELPIRYLLHIGSEIKLNPRNKIRKTAFISPNVLFSKQRDFYQLNVGAQINYDLFFGGIWFRHTFTNADAVIFMVGFQKSVFKLAYSYDWTVSKLGAKAGGAHEVSLILNFENPNQKYQQRYNDCLEIFR
ncbi:MAG: type IX secretion system membrane protein PorP/SprF [Aureispira sp.]|nr:type IX secretion system membrane protein PorP/SprF [Aureispira sp.]